jgi:shikimate kinase
MRTGERGIVIVGFMGAGKTTVARQLAQQTGQSFTDLDQLIVEREQRSIAAIIDAGGESYFRELESKALAAVLRADFGGVIALGGGTWTIPENRSYCIEAHTVSVWLDTPFEICWERIRDSGTLRPLVREEAEARMLFEQRQAAYSTADMRIKSTDDMTVESIVRTTRQRVAGFLGMYSV